MEPWEAECLPFHKSPSISVAAKLVSGDGISLNKVMSVSRELSNYPNFISSQLSRIFVYYYE